ncbi:hypothetical protein HU755_23820 [Pseudomonas sp. SWRI111]|uniref:hypothetical protein n=1 Tax=Pseudomonas sp. SWRI111 TaxID=2745507 RepID=UPI00164486DE|nr:hypothetical protein [Pseudomonas sp. SWRI111]MBC3209840.1 hypothetical protein [Pseudomonas sp. SWRI111]
MTAENVFISRPGTEDRFNWNYGSDVINATTVLLFETQFPGSPISWNFLGMTGTDGAGNVHGYHLSIHKAEDLIERTFTLADGLFCRFFKSQKIGSSYGRSYTSPNRAELTLRFDLTTGIAVGDYNAFFRSTPEARQVPRGTFKLSLYNPEHSQRPSTEEIYKLQTAYRLSERRNDRSERSSLRKDSLDNGTTLL